MTTLSDTSTRRSTVLPVVAIFVALGPLVGGLLVALALGIVVAIHQGTLAPLPGIVVATPMLAYGFGGVLALLIGLVVDLVLSVLEPPRAMAVRVLFLVAGVGVFAPGIALYVGAALGPGPRDGLMTNLARRGMSIRAARTLVELGALVAGFALGGTVGLGTLLYALAIGPTTQWWMKRLPGHVVIAPATALDRISDIG